MLRKLSGSLSVLVLIMILLATSVAQVGATSPDGPPTGLSLADLQQAAGATLEISWNAETGVPDFIVGQIPTAGLAPTEADATARAMAFLRAYSSVFKLQDPDQEFSVVKSVPDELGMTHVKLQQTYQGVKVYASDLIVHMKGQTITAVNGYYRPGISISSSPKLSAGEGEANALKDLTTLKPAPAPQKDAKGVDITPAADPYAAKADIIPGKTELLVYSGSDGYHLVWAVRLAAQNPFGVWIYFVDAQSGQVVYKYSDMEDGRNRLTYTLNNSVYLPGTLLRTESGPPSGDATANAAHDNIGIVYNYYWNTFHRDSYNGAGGTLKSYVHLDVNYNNAFWSDTWKAMFYGDGDGVEFSPLAYGLDVVAHELTHGVTASEANLVYENQPGALNESISDVFGVMVDRDDWLIGETVYTPAIPGDALRSMSNPPLYGQPDHVNDFLVSSNDQYGDYGGVHTNSGITNKAAYLIATAIGRAKTEQIWYRTLTLYLTASSDFNAMRTASLAAASDLYGYASPEWKAVNNGFASVGITRVVAQSAHPYASSYDNTWTITNPDPLATSTQVHFSALSVETNWDYVRIMNASGTTVQTLTGKNTNLTSVAVPGRTIKIRLTSDSSVTKWGFTVDKVISATRAATTYKQYVPAVMDNAYGGWSTGIGIRNTSASAGAVYVIYYDPVGTIVRSDAATVSGNGYWGVAQGGKFGGNWAGSATVQTNLPVKVEVNETGPAGKAMGYNASATPSAAAYLPVILDNAYGGWTTGIGLRNTAASSASVTIRYYNSAGTQVSSETATIEANGYWGNYQGGKLGSGFAGSAIVSSTQPVVAIVNEISTSGASISYNGFASGNTTVNLPVILNNAYGGFTTGVGIMNIGASSGSGSIAYYNSNGTLRTTQPITLPRRGYVGLYQGGLLPNGWAGSAVITMNQPVIAIVNESKSSGDALGYSGVGSGALVVNLPVVMDNAYGGWNTGAAIQNTSASPATVNVTYYNSSGGVLNTASAVIPAKGYWGLYQGGALGSGNAGSAKITSTQPIAVVANETGPGGSAIAYNGIP